MEEIALYTIRVLWKRRHDGYVHHHYHMSKKNFRGNGQYLRNFKEENGYVFFGAMLTRRDDLRFWVRILRDSRIRH